MMKASPRLAIGCWLLFQAALCQAGLINRESGVENNLQSSKENATYDSENNVCVFDDVLYRAGDHIPGDKRCERCVCEPPGFSCGPMPCEMKAGCKALQKPNQCCPVYQCECEKNGRTYQNGEKLEDPESPCEVCYCKGGEVACTTIECYRRDDCEPQLVPGRCCPKYDHCPPIEPQHANRPHYTRSTFQPTSEGNTNSDAQRPTSFQPDQTSSPSEYETSHSVPALNSTSLNAEDKYIGVSITQLLGEQADEPHAPSTDDDSSTLLDSILPISSEKNGTSPNNLSDQDSERNSSLLNNDSTLLHAETDYISALGTILPPVNVPLALDDESNKEVDMNKIQNISLSGEKEDETLALGKDNVIVDDINSDLGTTQPSQADDALLANNQDDQEIAASNLHKNVHLLGEKEDEISSSSTGTATYDDGSSVPSTTNDQNPSASDTETPIPLEVSEGIYTEEMITDDDSSKLGVTASTLVSIGEENPSGENQEIINAAKEMLKDEEIRLTTLNIYEELTTLANTFSSESETTSSEQISKESHLEELGVKSELGSGEVPQAEGIIPYSSSSIEEGSESVLSQHSDTTEDGHVAEGSGMQDTEHSTEDIILTTLVDGNKNALKESYGILLTEDGKTTQEIDSSNEVFTTDFTTEYYGSSSDSNMDLVTEELQTITNTDITSESTNKLKEIDNKLSSIIGVEDYLKIEDKESTNSDTLSESNEKSNIEASTNSNEVNVEEQTGTTEYRLDVSTMDPTSSVDNDSNQANSSNFSKNAVSELISQSDEESVTGGPLSELFTENESSEVPTKSDSESSDSNLEYKHDVIEGVKVSSVYPKNGADESASDIKHLEDISSKSSSVSGSEITTLLQSTGNANYKDDIISLSPTDSITEISPITSTVLTDDEGTDEGAVTLRNIEVQATEPSTTEVPITDSTAEFNADNTEMKERNNNLQETVNEKGTTLETKSDETTERISLPTTGESVNSTLGDSNDQQLPSLSSPSYDNLKEEVTDKNMSEEVENKNGNENDGLIKSNTNNNDYKEQEGHFKTDSLPLQLSNNEPPILRIAAELANHQMDVVLATTDALPTDEFINNTNVGETSYVPSTDEMLQDDPKVNANDSKNVPTTHSEDIMVNDSPQITEVEEFKPEHSAEKSILTDKVDSNDKLILNNDSTETSTESSISEEYFTASVSKEENCNSTQETNEEIQNFGLTTVLSNLDDTTVIPNAQIEQEKKETIVQGQGTGSEYGNSDISASEQHIHNVNQSAEFTNAEDSDSSLQSSSSEDSSEELAVRGDGALAQVFSAENSTTAPILDDKEGQITSETLSSLDQVSKGDTHSSIEGSDYSTVNDESLLENTSSESSSHEQSVTTNSGHDDAANSTEITESTQVLVPDAASKENVEAAVTQLTQADSHSTPQENAEELDTVISELLENSTEGLSLVQRHTLSQIKEPIVHSMSEETDENRNIVTEIVPPKYNSTEQSLETESVTMPEGWLKSENETSQSTTVEAVQSDSDKELGTTTNIIADDNQESATLPQDWLKVINNTSEETPIAPLQNVSIDKVWLNDKDSQGASTIEDDRISVTTNTPAETTFSDHNMEKTNPIIVVKESSDGENSFTEVGTTLDSDDVNPSTVVTAISYSSGAETTLDNEENNPTTVTSLSLTDGFSTEEIRIIVDELKNENTVESFTHKDITSFVPDPTPSADNFNSSKLVEIVLGAESASNTMLMSDEMKSSKLAESHSNTDYSPSIAEPTQSAEIINPSHSVQFVSEADISTPPYSDTSLASDEIKPLELADSSSASGSSSNVAEIMLSTEKATLPELENSTLDVNSSALLSASKTLYADEINSSVTTENQSEIESESTTEFVTETTGEQSLSDRNDTPYTAESNMYTTVLSHITSNDGEHAPQATTLNEPSKGEYLKSKVHAADGDSVDKKDLIILQDFFKKLYRHENSEESAPL